jgi:succinate dehydrogenase/fumarate reductase flavoprotein subunit
MSEMFDVVVVGFGLSGAVAAIEAHDAGARVVVLEKDSAPGGISICAGGGARITTDVSRAFDYLKATNAGTTPDSVLMTLARGLAALPDYYRKLAEPLGATVRETMTKGNYLVPGYESMGHVNVDEVPGFDAAREYPHVRVETSGGLRIFKLVHEAVKRRGIPVRLGTAVTRLWHDDNAVKGVFVGDRRIGASRAVILCCGGFEAAPDLQRQFWSIPPVMPASTIKNTGDGIKMAQQVGAGLWHMWHFHGVYGFHHPDREYKMGIRIRRLRNWVSGVAPRQDNKVAWIIVDQSGRRFMNEYEPYQQDTNHRAMAYFDPAARRFPRIPSVLVVDAAGRRLSALADPTWNDGGMTARFGSMTSRDFDEQLFATKSSLGEIADEFGLDRQTFADTIDGWNAACKAGVDRAFGRLPGSMMAIAEPPFSAAYVWPIVSNTQGGLMHDEEQRVLNGLGEPISRLFVAGELGSVFGHLYTAGGNISECFIGGRIAGTAAARLEPRIFASAAA